MTAENGHSFVARRFRVRGLRSAIREFWADDESGFRLPTRLSSWRLCSMVLTWSTSPPPPQDIEAPQ